MLEIQLIINSPEGEQTVGLNGKLSIGRTSLADVALTADQELSRIHATFELINDQIWVFDEQSMNGTFVNGGPVSMNGSRLQNSDIITLGSNTQITIKVQSPLAEIQNSSNSSPKIEKAELHEQNPKSKLPFVLIFAGISAFAIVFLAALMILVVSVWDSGKPSSKNKDSTRTAGIPVEVIDPLKGDPQDLEELLEAWEVQENPLEAKDVQEIAASNEAPELIVKVADWEKQRAKAFEPRGEPVGLVNVNVPPELAGRGIPKQIAKIKELGLENQLPQDFVALAQMRERRELVELPLATEDYVLDVGGSATDAPFTSFNFETRQKTEIALGSIQFNILLKLANNFGGQKYDLTVARDRKQMRQRLLRMFRPAAKPILEELARSYRQKFNRPLRVTSLARSLEYQSDLSKVNSNAFRGATPPHTTGCAFDLAWMQMTAAEQNFLMAKIAELENASKIDALREVGVAPCFHIFVYPDGQPPK